MKTYKGKQKQEYEGTVAFADAKEIHKKEVRGLLRKRAKQYDSDSEGDESNQKQKRDRKAGPSSFGSAF